MQRLGQGVSALPATAPVGQMGMRALGPSRRLHACLRPAPSASSGQRAGALPAGPMRPDAPHGGGSAARCRVAPHARPASGGAGHAGRHQHRPLRPSGSRQGTASQLESMRPNPAAVVSRTHDVPTSNPMRSTGYAVRLPRAGRGSLHGFPRPLTGRASAPDLTRSAQRSVTDSTTLSHQTSPAILEHMAREQQSVGGSGLGIFLRTRRAQLTPEDVGLAAGAGLRRSPGLRREELATLAGISIDYYARLERGQETNPSPAVVDALARAPAGRPHARAPARPRRACPGTTRPATRRAWEPGCICGRVHGFTYLPGSGYVRGHAVDVDFAADTAGARRCRAASGPPHGIDLDLPRAKCSPVSPARAGL